MLPIDLQLISTSADYLHTATNLRTVVCGVKGCWAPVVRGDAEDGAEVTVASYERRDYELKADAAKRARQMLAVIKAVRN